MAVIRRFSEVCDSEIGAHIVLHYRDDSREINSRLNTEVYKCVSIQLNIEDQEEKLRQ